MTPEAMSTSRAVSVAPERMTSATGSRQAGIATANGRWLPPAQAVFAESEHLRGRPIGSGGVRLYAASGLVPFPPIHQATCTRQAASRARVSTTSATASPRKAASREAVGCTREWEEARSLRVEVRTYSGTAHPFRTWGGAAYHAVAVMQTENVSSWWETWQRNYCQLSVTDCRRLVKNRYFTGTAGQGVRADHAIRRVRNRAVGTNRDSSWLELVPEAAWPWRLLRKRVRRRRS